jgi:hypothetical protein
MFTTNWFKYGKHGRCFFQTFVMFVCLALHWCKMFEAFTECSSKKTAQKMTDRIASPWKPPAFKNCLRLTMLKFVVHGLKHASGVRSQSSDLSKNHR